MVRNFLFISMLASLILSSQAITIAQDLDNIRSITISTSQDTIIYDTLATVGGSMMITDSSGRVIDDTSYTLIAWHSKLMLEPYLVREHRRLWLKYRVFPPSLTQRGFHKDIGEIQQIPEQVFTWQKISRNQRESGRGFPSADIIQSGSISRAITLGNNQDAVVNSGLDLQLSGSLGNNLNITGVLSDKNVPIQPDGTTQKINELDRVYIQVYNDQTQVTGGDFKISEGQGYFMKMNKKVQGARVKHRYQALGNAQAVTSFSGAISRGKHCTQNFLGEEGNQGPYRLNGCDDETYIIILSGSEKVYIDGQLMKRGKNNDYVINYNTAEITFTANQPITKDKRIVVEFEYSLREYTRFMAFTHNSLRSERGSLWLNVFTQQDNKTSTLAQDLNDQEKTLLARAGDDLKQARVPYIDTGSYRENNNLILYTNQDTLVGGKRYSIYSYSTDPDQARLKVGFSYSGKNKGNYILKKSAANGRVYQWVAPKNGVPQGSYTPERQLIPPRKQQMLTFGGEGNIAPGMNSSFELALSNNDLNTFSSLDQGDNKGYALKFNLNKQFLLTDTSRSRISSSFSYRGVQKDFTPVERFRAVEFGRDWNLRHRTVSGNEHLFSGSVSYWHRQAGRSRYRFEYLSYQNGYQGYRNQLNSSLQYHSYRLDFKGNLLKTQGPNTQTDFVRYQAHASKHFPYLVAGIRNNAEYNRWKADTLMRQSFSFNEWQFYLRSPDSLTNQYFINYQIRDDRRPLRGQLEPVTRGRDLNIGLKIHSLANNRLTARITYRQLQIRDTSLTDSRPEDHLIGRIEHSMHLFNDLLRTSTHFEVGSGLEPRKEFTYIEVPDGQGLYKWSDYNENGIKELDEFEKARFQDQADYLRVYRPSGEYFKTHTHEFNHTLHLNPGQVIRDTSFFARLASRFSDQLAYRIRRKNQQNQFWENLNPFAYRIGNPDVLSQSSNLRNTLSFNKDRPNYHLDYIFLISQNKSLLMNGTELKEDHKHGIHLTWNINEALTLLNRSSIEAQRYKSEFFENKNYHLKNLKESFSLRYHPSSAMRFELGYEFADMNNRQGPQEAIRHQVNLEFQISRVKQFRLQGQTSLIHFNYGAPENTPVAYQMLQGLKPGKNATWSLVLQKEIYQNLDLNLNYSGRTSQGHRAIHTGQVELRASF